MVNALSHCLTLAKYDLEQRGTPPPPPSPQY